jgi:hypothetical protein
VDDENVLRSHQSLFPKLFNAMITKHDKQELQVYKHPLINKIGTAKSIKLVVCDLAQFDTREMYEFFGNEEYEEIPQALCSPSKLQTRLLLFLSDTLTDVVKAQGGDKYLDLTKFMKGELVTWLSQLFRSLVQNYRENQNEEDFIRIVWDQEKIIAPQLEARRNYLLNPPLKK